MSNRPIVRHKVVRNDNPLRSLRKNLELAKKSYVTVGVHEDAGMYEAEPGQEPVPVSKVAFWLEQGTQHMPARPFFYPALANNQPKLKAMYQREMSRILAGRLNVKTALGRIGFAAQTWIQNVIKSNVPPALSSGYAKARQKKYPEQGTRTLIASGLLLRSVRYKLYLGNDEPVLGPSDAPEAESPQHDGQGNFTGKSRDEHGAERKAARQSAGDFKARQKAQRETAKANPQANKDRFLAQRRVPTSHKPKGS